LDDAVASGTSQLRANLTDHFDSLGHILQDFRDIFPQLFQFPATVRACFLGRRVGLHFAPQMRGQRPPHRSGHGSLRGAQPWRFRFERSTLFQFSQLQFQLRDLAIHLFRRSSELHPAKLGEQQLEVFDLRIAGKQLLVMDQNLLVLFYDQGFQFTGIEYFEVGKNARRMIHRGEYTAVVLQFD
jgi:hypothetical protein